MNNKSPITLLAVLMLLVASGCASLKKGRDADEIVGVYKSSNGST